MKKLSFLLFILFIPFYTYAQYEGGSYASKSYVLLGETEIVLKNGQKVMCQDKIAGTKLGNTDIDYKDVDYIRLVKTKLTAYSKMDGSIFKFIIVKDKPQLVLVIVESPNLSFYKERPKTHGGGSNAIGVYQPFTDTYDVFMIKNGETKKVDFGDNWKNMKKIFPDCPRLIQYQQDKQLRKSLAFYEVIVYLYNNCAEASPDDLKKDKYAIDKIVLNAK